MEDQVEQSQQRETQGTPGRNAAEAAADAGRQRQRAALELQRERILDERTSNPIRRQALAAALADIESKLAGL